MGSGISLNKAQIIEITKRELIKEFNLKEQYRDMYCDGYLIYYDFEDEYKLNKKINKLNEILRNIEYTKK